MNKRMVNGVEVELSSGNVFADVGLPDADKLKIKSGLMIEITKAMRNLGLSQEEAGRRMGLPQPKLSGLLRGDFSNVSERKLMDCLNCPIARILVRCNVIPVIKVLNRNKCHNIPSRHMVPADPLNIKAVIRGIPCSV